MSPTESLRKDHALIEKMIKALQTISSLLSSGKQIPESILNQAIDFSINFTNTCHHGKEEESLFPTLESKGMPREGGPIARMLYRAPNNQKPCRIHYQIHQKLCFLWRLQRAGKGH